MYQTVGKHGDIQKKNVAFEGSENTSSELKKLGSVAPFPPKNLENMPIKWLVPLNNVCSLLRHGVDSRHRVCMWNEGKHTSINHAQVFCSINF